MTAYLERAARRMAEGMNGGSWETHYTEAQKQVWRDRVAAIWSGRI